MATGIRGRYRPIDTLHAAAAYVDDEGRILVENEAFRTLMREHGRPPGEPPEDRLTLPLLLSARDRGAVRELLAAPQRRARCTSRTVTLAGSSAPMLAEFVSVRRQPHNRTFWFVTLKPSDEGEPARDLASMAAVTAGIVHDLRTPVQLVLGWASFLRRRPDDAERMQHALAIIERNAELLTELLEELVARTRASFPRTRTRSQQIDLVALLHAEIRAMQPIADANGVRLSLVSEPSTLTVAGDAIELRRVVINLLDNALKFTPRHGAVECRLWEAGGWACMAVRDNGAGIRPEFLTRVFDAFVQESGEQRRQGEGIGLGLAVVRQLVELHGGSVTVASAGPGSGATFTVRLPATAAVPLRENPLRENPRVSEAGRRSFPPARTAAAAHRG